MRRVLVVAIAAVLGSGVWSTIAASASPASSVRSTPSPAPAVAVEVEVEVAPVCPAEQIEAAGDVAPSADGSTVVSFTLVDPRCTS